MRLVELSTFHETCGIATYSEALCDCLKGYGVEVYVLSPRLAYGDTRPLNDPACEEQPKRLWRRSRASGFEALRTYREIRRLGVHIVHVQVNLGLFSARFLFTLGQLLRVSGIVLVATLHGRSGGSLGRKFKHMRFLRALKGTTFIVHNAEHAREFQQSEVHVIPHGIHPPPSKIHGEAKRVFGIKRQTPVLAHFGFLHPDKGIEAMLQAVARLRQQGYSELQYKVIGGTLPTRTSQNYLNHLRRLVRELDLANQVHLPGHFFSEQDVLSELQAADWIVLNYQTGSHQGTSGAVRHALTSGRPVAVSESPIFDDLRPHVYTLDQSLVSSLNRLLSDPELACSTMEKALRYCEACSWTRVAKQHVELFESLLRKSAGI